MATKRFCDRCGKETDYDEKDLTGSANDARGHDLKVDLCAHCWADLNRFLKGQDGGPS